MSRRAPRSFDKPLLPIPARLPAHAGADERRSPTSSVEHPSRTSSKRGSPTSQTKREAKSPQPAEKRIKRDPGYVIEIVYDDPNDLLQEAPKTRSNRRNGDLIGEILFYGDEIMFGVDANQSYPEVLRERLTRCGLRLVVNALPGRTLNTPDAAAVQPLLSPDLPQVTGDVFNGAHHIGPVFSSHSPLYVVVGLGTNDLKHRLREYHEEQGQQVTADFIVAEVTRFVELCRVLVTGHCHEGKIKVIVVVPPPIRLTDYTRQLGFDQRSVDLAEQLRTALLALRALSDVAVVDVGAVAAKWTNGLCPSSASMAVDLAETVWDAIDAELPRPVSFRNQRKE